MFLIWLLSLKIAASTLRRSNAFSLRDCELTEEPVQRKSSLKSKFRTVLSRSRVSFDSITHYSDHESSERNLKFFKLSEEEYEKLSETNQKLQEFLFDGPFLKNCAIQGLIFDFIRSSFRENMSKNRRLIDLWRYPLPNFSSHMNCFCDISHSDYPYLSTFLRIIELLKPTSFFTSALHNGSKTGNEDLTRCWSVFTQFYIASMINQITLQQ